MLSVAFEAVEVFGLSAARILATSTSGRLVALRIVRVNQATSGRFLCLIFHRATSGRFFVFCTKRLGLPFFVFPAFSNNFWLHARWGTVVCESGNERHTGPADSHVCGTALHARVHCPGPVH